MPERAEDKKRKHEGVTMQDFFYNLQGGINLNRTHVALGFDTKKLYWDDAKNVEILKNSGMCRQKGNTLLLKLEDEEKIIGLFEYPKNTRDFIFLTQKGKICHYNVTFDTLRTLTTLKNPVSSCSFAHYLDGVIVCTDSNGGVYVDMGAQVEVSSLELTKPNNAEVTGCALCVYAGRVWVASGPTLYFSALGRYNDWTSSDDAGYIEKFHCSTSNVIALKEYIGCMAIYKQDGVWLLSGTNPEEFAISRFADKGILSHNSVLTCDNKQFFLCRAGVFALEQGEFAQISLSSNIGANVQEIFEKINYDRALETLVISNDSKTQVWFFLPFDGKDHLNEILIYDYACHAWYKRVIPYEITSGASIFGSVYTASARGEVFLENSGNTFAGKPIKFSLSSPFFHLGAPTTRKIIENMTFIFDESHENRFRFAVSKDYVNSERFDVEFIDILQPDCLVWQTDEEKDEFRSVWGEDDDILGFNWAEPVEESYKTDIFDSNSSVQLHIQGEEAGDDFAIVGIEFKEILIDN